MGIEEFLLERAKKEGILEERNKRNYEIAETLLKKGMSIQEVSEISTLSIEVVTRIAGKLNKGSHK